MFPPELRYVAASTLPARGSTFLDWNCGRLLVPSLLLSYFIFLPDQTFQAPGWREGIPKIMSSCASSPHVFFGSRGVLSHLLSTFALDEDVLQPYCSSLGVKETRGRVPFTPLRKFSLLEADASRKYLGSV